MALMGGELLASSTGKGATVVMRLPLAERVARDNGHAGPVRILLVDDHEDTLSLMRLMLERRGHAVVTAGSVAEALALAGQSQPDLLISDIGLPDESGLELLRRLQARRPILGIALSGFGRDSDVQRSKEAGFVAHLTKPVNVQRLCEIIQRLFD
jgi:CheY-like chemotaxis protein